MFPRKQKKNQQLFSYSDISHAIIVTVTNCSALLGSAAKILSSYGARKQNRFLENHDVHCL
ncbi:hypothetical protein STRCR_1089 [Streptococcus criceti HS-6]|uniref:Uncharacterized protein n=1 Tax=Streptococcus criceti HS-6 TaxID=873449 RepID=G5JTJ2_STRCG|nr:hypothetical protein STRCR_1089 [Streptococcus criceti HS-6]